MASDSKDRMVRSAFVLFREKGYSGTGLREVNDHSGVTRGAIYHHFPGGKAELAENVVRLAGTEVAAALEAGVDTTDPVATVAAFVAGWAHHLRAHEFGAGCSIAAVVGEIPPDEPRLAAAAKEAFGLWEAIFADALQHGGVAPARARRLGTLAVAAVEGAVLLCRAERSTGPLDDVGKELRDLFRDAAA